MMITKENFLEQCGRNLLIEQKALEIDTIIRDVVTENKDKAMNVKVCNLINDAIERAGINADVCIRWRDLYSSVKEVLQLYVSINSVDYRERKEYAIGICGNEECYIGDIRGTNRKLNYKNFATCINRQILNDKRNIEELQRAIDGLDTYLAKFEGISAQLREVCKDIPTQYYQFLEFNPLNCILLHIQ